MSLPDRFLGAAFVAVVLAFGGLACARKESAEKASAPEAPLSAGYESALASRPIFRPSGTAPAVWGPGDLYNLLITGDESKGALFQFEAIVPQGGGPPAHVHSREDETFYVVKGSLEVLLGDSLYRAKAGDFVYIPRGTVHRFKNLGNQTAVQLVTFTPSGMEKFFREVFPAVTDRNAAPPPVTDDLIRRMNEAAPRHGIVFPANPDSGTP